MRWRAWAGYRVDWWGHLWYGDLVSVPAGKLVGVGWRCLLVLGGYWLLGIHEEISHNFREESSVRQA